MKRMIAFLLMLALLLGSVPALAEEQMILAAEQAPEAFAAENEAGFVVAEQMEEAGFAADMDANQAAVLAEIGTDEGPAEMIAELETETIEEAEIFTGLSANDAAENTAEAVVEAVAQSELQIMEAAAEQPADIGMMLNVDQATLGVGEKLQLVPELSIDECAQFSYKSKSTKIATVNKDGLITAKKAGKTVIYVTASNGAAAECEIVVKKAPGSVKLSSKKMTISVGQAVQLQSGVNSGAAGRLSYAANSDIISVDENGMIRALAEGTAKVTVSSYNGKKASCTVTVVPAPTCVALEGDHFDLPMLTTAQLKPVVDAGCVSNYSYSTSDESIAIVDENGLITALSVGTAVITVSTHNGLTAECSVNVTIAPTKISLNFDQATLGLGEKLQLAAEADQGEDVVFSYKSKSAKIAAVNKDGLITAKKAGKTVIYVSTFNGVTAECEIVVKKAPGSVKLNMKAITLMVGSEADLDYTLSSGSAGSVSFSSSDENIVRVDENGLITAIAAGTAKITARTFNGKKATCTVTTQDPVNTITALRTEGNTAIATVITLQECRLYVEVLDENSEETLMSATAPVEAELQMEDISAELPDALPANYILRGVLLDEDGEALCPPYITRRYTSAYQEFEQQSPTDFPAERVLDMGSAGYAVYSSTTYPVDSRVTQSDGKYTFMPPAELKPGYVVIIDDEPVKIETIHYNPEGTVTITRDSEIYLSDIYDALHLDKTIAVQPAVRAFNLARDGGVDLFEFSADISYGPLTLEGKTSMSLNVRAFYDKNFFGADYFEYETYVDAKGSVTLELGKEFKSEDLKNPPVLSLYEGDIPTGVPGITATLDVEVPVEIEAEAKGKIEAGFEVRAGFNYDPVNGKRAIESKDISLSGGLEGKFEVKAGPKISVGVKIVCLEGQVSGMAGFKAEGELKGLNTDREYSADNSRYHACMACVDMNLDAFAEFEGEIKYEITKKIKGNLANLRLFSSEWEIGDAFLSITNEPNSIYKGMPKFGMGDCQNMKYRVLVHTQDVDGQTVYGKPVVIMGVGFKQPVSIPGESSMEEYLYPGSYTASVKFSELVNIASTEDFIVYDAPLEVIVSEGSVTVKGTITDAKTKKAISGATVLFEHERGTTRTATTDANGQYTLENIGGGKYTVAVTAQGYEPREDIEVSYLPYSVNTLDAALTPEPPDPTGKPFIRVNSWESSEEIKMGGWTYDDAVIFQMGYTGLGSTASMAEASYNFQGKYSSMSFDACYFSGWERDAELTVIADGNVVYDKVKLKYTDIAKRFTVNLSGVHKLLIHFTSDGYDKTNYAIGDIKLTKAGETIKKPIECMEGYDERRYLLDAATVVKGDYSMGGYNYRDGYNLMLGYPWNMKYTGIVGFNFRGEYSSLSFDIARYDDDGTIHYPRSATLTIEVDGVPVAGYNEKELVWSDVSEKVKVNISGASQVLIKVYSNGYDNLHWRIGNVHYS